MPLDTAPGPDQLTKPPGGGGYVPLVQGPLPGWGTAPILTWTRPASRYRSTKVLSLGTDWLSPSVKGWWRVLAKDVDFCGRQGRG